MAGIYYINGNGGKNEEKYFSGISSYFSTSTFEITNANIDDTDDVHL